jgi:hypothetical protein
MRLFTNKLVSKEKQVMNSPGMNMICDFCEKSVVKSAKIA